MNAKEIHITIALASLVDACYQAAFTSGWWIDADTGEDVRDWPKKFFMLWVGTKLALIHSEVSEGLEGYRKNLMDDKLPHRTMLEVELADLVIRACDLAGGLNIDLGGAIVEKLAFNAQRVDHKPENRATENGKKF
jgi:NTP pyrophosphatase (non-canonical NTP hydrolase)